MWDSDKPQIVEAFTPNSPPRRFIPGNAAFQLRRPEQQDEC
jgi:hypothetical protein